MEKNDEMEGKYYTTKYQTPQGKGVNFTIDANKQKRNFALCLYHLNNKYSTSRIEEMFEFGEYVVKIEDELEFDKRIKNGAKENKYQLYSRDVLYYRDESIKDEMKIMDLMTNSLDDLSFIKRKEIFSYQNEKGADSFISGIVQFGRLKEYLYIEKKNVLEKMMRWKVNIIRQNIRRHKEKGLILRLMLINRKGILPYVYII